MADSFISEPIVPVRGTFDPAGMARGEPGLPQRFFWRDKEYAVAEVLATSKAHGNCRNGSGERYVRKHEYRVRTGDGALMRLYFQRTTGRGKLSARTRWMLHSIDRGAERSLAAA